MGQKAVVKRFIAGVVCPKCSKMDTTRMYRNEEGEEVRDCVACGFEETYSQHQANQQQPEFEEIKTRVTPEGKVLLDEEEQPLKIMDPGLSRKDH